MVNPPDHSYKLNVPSARCCALLHPLGLAKSLIKKVVAVKQLWRGSAETTPDPAGGGGGLVLTHRPLAALSLLERVLRIA